jgi:lipopolysaccharide/colanic/teichoic acid biosynthesis glycosyltransferase
MAFQSTCAAPCAQPAKDGVSWKAMGWGGRLGALLLLWLLAPFLALIALAIVILARRSPLVAHRRVGRNGRSFWTYKFRSMWSADAARNWPLVEYVLVEYVDEEPGLVLKGADDPRITSRFARFCRRYSIDELPQLYNIVCGEMAFVGPRPLTREELRRHYAGDAPEVLTVTPGLTGLWQVMGRSRLTYPQRRRLDLFLVRHRSSRLYAAILLRTLPEVLCGRNSW